MVPKFTSLNFLQVLLYTISTVLELFIVQVFTFHGHLTDMLCNFLHSICLELYCKAVAMA